MMTSAPAIPRSITSLRDGWSSRIEAPVAALVMILVALRISLPQSLPWNVTVCILLAPVVLPYLTRVLGGVTFSVLCVVATVAGALLADMGTHEIVSAFFINDSVRMVGLVILLASMLWAREVLGTNAMIIWFAIGLLSSTVLDGVNANNPWKYGYSLPVILIVLSLLARGRRRWPQVLGCLVLAAISLLADSRSSAGFLLIAAALMMSQRHEDSRDTRSLAVRRWLVVARSLITGLGGFFLLQAVILEGLLGETIQSRTRAQIEASGSVFAGGRPEMGAAFSLLTERPWGFGAGSLPNQQDVQIAKVGMTDIGYDPNNNYVERFMFGYGFEVHSVLGDMWLIHGVAGLAVALMIAFLLVRGVAQKMALGTASSVVLYLAVRSLWDLAFSPFASSIRTLVVALAVVAIAKGSATLIVGRRSKGADRRG